ncbi:MULTISPECIES: hypothetical protein [unclassified Streptomyces]|uniref:hypothetical protein n=1 Tax=unclassified Streptomyces TaxID=2593676 RepID=UPI0031BB6AC2
MTPHLAEWFLACEQFEPAPHQPRLFRLSEPERDGPRRTRQAVKDLRSHGYAVHADLSLDPATPVSPLRPALPDGVLERRCRLAQAAAGRSPQRSPAPSTSPPSAWPIPPKPTYAPTIHWAVPGAGRRR